MVIYVVTDMGFTMVEGLHRVYDNTQESRT